MLSLKTNKINCGITQNASQKKYFNNCIEHFLSYKKLTRVYCHAYCHTGTRSGPSNASVTFFPKHFDLFYLYIKIWHFRSHQFVNQSADSFQDSHWRTAFILLTFDKGTLFYSNFHFINNLIFWRDQCVGFPLLSEIMCQLEMKHDLWGKAGAPISIYKSRWNSLSKLGTDSRTGPRSPPAAEPGPPWPAWAPPRGTRPPPSARRRGPGPPAGGRTPGRCCQRRIRPGTDTVSPQAEARKLLDTPRSARRHPLWKLSAAKSDLLGVAEVTPCPLCMQVYAF